VPLPPVPPPPVFQTTPEELALRDAEELEESLM
jgi:hypothetical protein